MKFQMDYDEVAGAYRMARTLLGCKCPFNTVCAITIPDIYPEDFDPKDPNDFENLVGMYGNDGFEMRAYCIGCHKRTKFVCGIEELPYISDVALIRVHEIASKNLCFHWDQLDISPKLGPCEPDEYDFWGEYPQYLLHKVYCHKCRKVFDVPIPSKFSVDFEPFMVLKAW